MIMTKLLKSARERIKYLPIKHVRRNMKKQALFVFDEKQKNLMENE